MQFQTKSDAIAERIEQDIIEGVFLPGTRLGQDELALRYGVSTTPVREALRHLCSSGLVVPFPHRGHIVAGRSADEIADILQVRITVEGLLAQRAAGNFSEEHHQDLGQLLAEMKDASRRGDMPDYRRAHDLFHDTLYQAANRLTLLEVSRALRKPFLTTVVQYLDAGVSLDDLHREHLEIAETARTGNGTALKNAVRRHVQAMRQHVVPYVKSLEGGQPRESSTGR